MNKSKTTPINKRQNREEVEYYPNGKMKSKIPYLYDKKHGLEIRWNGSGSKWCEITWREGKRHGVERWWDNSGQNYLEITWREDKPHDAITWWYERGKKQKEDSKCAQIEWDKNNNVTVVRFANLSDPNNPSLRSNNINQKDNQENHITS